MNLKHDAPIGVFDSGLGGLTVVREIVAKLPSERVVYLGDTARVPYGTRSAATVVRYARRCANHLTACGVKFLVVACNTVSAVALDILRVELDIPVLGVIEPGARAGLRATQSGRIGVIATAGTVQSGAYERAVRAGDSRAEVITQAAPLLVPLVEEGWVEGDVPRLAVRRYLEPLVEAGIDALILGCTHYPVLRTCIQNELDALGAGEVAIVDSAAATAQELGDSLAERGLVSQSSEQRRLRVMVTDTPGTFLSAASRFLGSDAEKLAVEGVDL